MKKTLASWLGFGFLALAVFPWHQHDDGLPTGDWLGRLFDARDGSALAMLLHGEQWAFAGLLLWLTLAALALGVVGPRKRLGVAWICLGV